jgi:hypothetical protein
VNSVASGFSNGLGDVFFPTALRTVNMAASVLPAPVGAHISIFSLVLYAPLENPEATEFTVQVDDFKIVYVAPMKALAAEVTETTDWEMCSFPQH